MGETPERSEPEYVTAGLDIYVAIQRLCRRWGPATVLRHTSDWVAYMERCIAVSNADSDPPPSDAAD